MIHSSSFCYFIILTWKPIETHYHELCTSPPSLDVKLIADESATKKCLILAHCSNSFTFHYTWYYTIHCASLLSPSSTLVTMKLPSSPPCLSGALFSHLPSTSSLYSQHLIVGAADTCPNRNHSMTNDPGDPLIWHLAPPAGQGFHLTCETSQLRADGPAQDLAHIRYSVRMDNNDHSDPWTCNPAPSTSDPDKWLFYYISWIHSLQPGSEINWI